MEYFSKIMPIFVPLVCKDRRHRGELFSFDPSENWKFLVIRVKA